MKENLNSKEAKELIESRQDIVILDVRTWEEFSSGHIKNAANLDCYNSRFKETIKGLNKKKTYIVYCQHGNRSSKVHQMMKEMGFENVYNLEGGLTAWED